MYRVDTRPLPMTSAWTVAATTSVEFILPGKDGQTIYVGGVQVTWATPQENPQQVKIFRNTTRVFHGTGTGTAANFTFPYPIAIRSCCDLLVVASNSAAGSNVNLTVLYLQE